MQKKKFQRLTAVLLAILMMVSLAAIAGAEETEDIVRDADVTVPDEGNVLVALRGSAAVKSEKQELLNTLNALRKEACDKGYPNPENPEIALTSEDYVPLEWNTDLEDMAQLRSAEGVVEESITRPSGKNSGTITINGTNTSREDIGWAWVDNAEGADLTELPALFYGYNGTSAAAGSEIARWISGGYSQDDTAVSHYAHLINPSYRSVGSAMFKISNGTIVTASGKEYYGRAVMCMVQELSRTETSEAKRQFSDLGGDYTQKVEVRPSYLKEMYFNDDTISAMETGTRETLVPTVVLHAGRHERYAHEIYIPDCMLTAGASWTSSRTSSATVNKNGRVSARAAGNVTISASAGNLSATQTIRITGEDADLPEDDVSERYEDVYPDKWYTPGVEYCVEHGLMTGISETMFDLSSHVNRAMVVTTLWAMEGKPEPKGTNRFSDVPAGRYFTKAVQWAAENEIVTGHVGGTYKPFDAVSRQQLVTIMYQYARLHEWDSQASGSLAPYVDQADISGYGVLPFRWAVGHGLISGRSETQLAPREAVMRSELATILMRFHQNIRT